MKIDLINTGNFLSKWTFKNGFISRFRICQATFDRIIGPGINRSMQVHRGLDKQIACLIQQKKKKTSIDSW